MPPRRRPLLAGLALALTAGCATGCSAGAEAVRQPGDPVTEAEAEELAELLVRNSEAGGADFVVTAPYAEDTVLRLTGEVDFAGGVGRARAVTRSGETEQTRTLFFTAGELWFGDVPGLAGAPAASGLPGAAYVRRPMAEGKEAPLTDVLVQVVLNLSAGEADDPAAFRGEGYTWQGERSIDGELTSVYASGSGWRVAVDRSSDLLVRYETRLPGEDVDVTVTLADHGEREITPPAEEESVDAAEHPELAGTVGL